MKRKKKETRYTSYNLRVKTFVQYPIELIFIRDDQGGNDITWCVLLIVAISPLFAIKWIAKSTVWKWLLCLYTSLGRFTLIQRQTFTHIDVYERVYIYIYAWYFSLYRLPVERRDGEHATLKPRGDVIRPSDYSLERVDYTFCLPAWEAFL